MEHGVMIGVLLAVVGVGLFGLYYVSTDNRQQIIYIPIMTGFSTYQTSNATINVSAVIDVELSAGNGSLVNPEVNVTPMDIVDPTLFDTFGNCNGCDAISVAGPRDHAFGGNTSRNATLCAILRTNSNVNINESLRLNATVPTGFNFERVTVNPFNTNTTPTGTNDTYARDQFVNTTFYAAGALALSTSYQQILANWSNGSGVGASNRYDIACQWSISPQNLARGAYTLRRDFLSVQASA